MPRSGTEIALLKGSKIKTREATMAVIKYPFQSQMYSPWRDIDEILSNRLTRFVEDVPNRREGNGMWSPQIGVTETKDEVILTAELPGISEKDVNIELEKNVLVISGEKTVERKEGEEGGDYHLLERASGSFRRSFTLPWTVAGSEATATLDNGVLDIRLPKTPDAAGHRIKISKN